MRASMDKHASMEVQIGSHFTTSRQASGRMPATAEQSPAPEAGAPDSTAPELPDLATSQATPAHQPSQIPVLLPSLLAPDGPVHGHTSSMSGSPGTAVQDTHAEAPGWAAPGLQGPRQHPAAYAEDRQAEEPIQESEAALQARLPSGQMGLLKEPSGRQASSTGLTSWASMQTSCPDEDEPAGGPE